MASCRNDQSTAAGHGGEKGLLPTPSGCGVTRRGSSRSLSRMTLESGREPTPITFFSLSGMRMGLCLLSIPLIYVLFVIVYALANYEALEANMNAPAVATTTTTVIVNVVPTAFPEPTRQRQRDMVKAVEVEVQEEEEGEEESDLLDGDDAAGAADSASIFAVLSRMLGDEESAELDGDRSEDGASVPFKVISSKEMPNIQSLLRYFGPYKLPGEPGNAATMQEAADNVLKRIAVREAARDQLRKGRTITLANEQGEVVASMRLYNLTMGQLVDHTTHETRDVEFPLLGKKYAKPFTTRPVEAEQEKKQKREDVDEPALYDPADNIIDDFIRREEAEEAEAAKRLAAEQAVHAAAGNAQTDAQQRQQEQQQQQQQQKPSARLTRRDSDNKNRKDQAQSPQSAGPERLEHKQQLERLAREQAKSKQRIAKQESAIIREHKQAIQDARHRLHNLEQWQKIEIVSKQLRGKLWNKAEVEQRREEQRLERQRMKDEISRLQEELSAARNRRTLAKAEARAAWGVANGRKKEAEAGALRKKAKAEAKALRKKVKAERKKAKHNRPRVAVSKRDVGTGAGAGVMRPDMVTDSEFSFLEAVARGDTLAANDLFRRLREERRETWGPTRFEAHMSELIERHVPQMKAEMEEKRLALEEGIDLSLPRPEGLTDTEFVFLEAIVRGDKFVQQQQLEILQETEIIHGTFTKKSFEDYLLTLIESYVPQMKAVLAQKMQKIKEQREQKMKNQRQQRMRNQRQQKEHEQWWETFPPPTAAVNRRDAGTGTRIGAGQPLQKPDELSDVEMVIVTAIAYKDYDTAQEAMGWLWEEKRREGFSLYVFETQMTEMVSTHLPGIQAQVAQLAQRMRQPPILQGSSRSNNRLRQPPILQGSSSTGGGEA